MLLFIVLIILSLSSPAFACGVCIATGMAHGMPFLFPWGLIFLFYIVWDFIVLSHMKRLEYYGGWSDVKTFFNMPLRKESLAIIIISVIFFCCAGPIGMLLISFVIFFIFFLSRLYSLFTMPYVPFYGIKIRYIVMNIMIFIAMAITYYLSLGEIPG